MMFLAFAFLKKDLGLLNSCRAQQLEIQNKAAKNLQKLLKLNPRALKLRMAQARAEKALMAAIESGLPPAIAAAEAYLLVVKAQRGALDFQQRTLIQTANVWLAFGGQNLQKRLLQEQKAEGTSLKSWLQSSLQLQGAKIPKLAVKADFPEMAPLYEIQPQFTEAQTWEQKWVLQLGTRAWAQSFLNFNGRFERSCSTSIYQDATQWSAKLKKAKSSSKAWF